MSKKYLKPQNKKQIENDRNEKNNTRLPRTKVLLDLVFSFAYFGTQISPNGVGQGFKEWENECFEKEILEQIKSLTEIYQKNLAENVQEPEFVKELQHEFLENLTKILEKEKKSSSQSFLCDFLDRLVDLSKKNILEAKGNHHKNLLAIYDDFDFENSDFKKPDFEIPENAKWGVIKKIGGQKGRVAGFLWDNIFYVVFLDKEHKFYKTEKKNT